MLIKINNPKGRIPRMSAKQLPVNYGQVATNCDFRSGNWTPLGQDPTPSGASWTGDIAETLFKINGVWIPWTSDVDVIETPVANDDYRFLYTGDGYPKQSMPAWTTTKNPPTTTRRLGVIAPDGVAEITFNSGGTTEITAGDKVVGATSEAAADVLSVEHTSGTWAGGDEVGKLYVRILSGIWNSSENIDIFGGQTNAATTTAFSGKGTSLAATPQGTGDGRVLESVAYLYVGVTAWGEISAISAVSDVEDVEGGEYIKLTGFVINDLTITGNDIASFYVYRATISASGQRSYNMIKVRPALASADPVYSLPVADVPLASTEIFDCNDTPDGLNYDIGDPIPSLYWQPPPNALKGLCQYQNGIVAGFDGKKVYLSERGYYYAFNDLNIVEVNYTIVGLAPFNDTLIVVTDAYPYMITGNDPAGAVVKKIENLAPCVSKKSIASTPSGVYWASDNGLFFCDGYKATNITTRIYTEEQWAALTPSNLMGFVWKEYYYGFFIGRYTGIKLPLNTMDSVIDITIGSSYEFACGFISADDNALYVLVDTGMNLVKEWESSTSSFKTMSWKSGKIQTRPTNLACAKIISSDFADNDGGSINFSLWAYDGSLGLPASDDVVGFWPIDAANENPYRIYDISGNDHDGILYGSPTWVNGINFPIATPSYADAASASELNFGLTDFSVTFWVRFNTGATQQKWIMGKGAPLAGAAPGWGIECTSTADPVPVTLYVSDGTDAPANHTKAFGNLTRGTSYMLTFTVDRTNGIITLYLNGASVGTLDITGIGVFDGGYLIFGAGNNDTGNTSDLALDDIIIYSKALEASEIETLYNNPTLIRGLKVSSQAISSDEPFWLPSGFQASEWEVQISGAISVDSIMLAHTPEELTPNV